MDKALEYVARMSQFTEAVNGKVTPGRRFDRVIVDGQTKFFVEKDSLKIFGAKSSFQYNPRREYGTLETIPFFDWVNLVPLAGTEIAREWHAREDAIKSTYKQRGRPRKTPVTQK